MGHNTMKSVALAAQCLRPTTAVVRSFHNNMPTAFPKDSPYIEAMRQYKAELTGQRKIFQAAIDEQVSTKRLEALKLGRSTAQCTMSCGLPNAFAFAKGKSSSQRVKIISSRSVQLR